MPPSARSYDDLADDMIRGTRPQPRCPAEELALWLAIGWPNDLIHDLTEAFDIDDLPILATDYRWDDVLDAWTPDLDIEPILDPSCDGIERPDAERNRTMRIGDHRAAAWFEPNLDYPPRDPTRGFRRLSARPARARPTPPRHRLECDHQPGLWWAGFFPARDTTRRRNPPSLPLH